MTLIFWLITLLIVALLSGHKGQAIILALFVILLIVVGFSLFLTVLAHLFYWITGFMPWPFDLLFQ